MARPKAHSLQLNACASLLLCCACVFCGVKLGQPKWENLTGGTHSNELPLLSVFFFDANNGIAVTTLNLQRTVDGGKTWAVQFEDEGKVLNFITFTSPTTGFIAGTERKASGSVPMILHTEDGGESWQESLIPTSPQTKPNVTSRLHGISFCDRNVGWAAGTNLILHTTDGGRIWETQRSGDPEESFFGVQCVNSKTAWVVGQAGVILNTKNGGEGWSRQESGTNATLLRVRSFGVEGWVVGLDGTLLHTRDGGATWECKRLDIDEALFDIYIEGRQGWAVGSYGTILQSKDSGETWRRYESPTRNDLVNLFFMSPKQGWAAGDRHTLLHFSD